MVQFNRFWPRVSAPSIVRDFRRSRDRQLEYSRDSFSTRLANFLCFAFARSLSYCL